MKLLRGPSPPRGPTTKENSMRALALALVASALLGACAMTPTIDPGTTTEAQVISTYGQPTRRWSNPGGTTTLEYATQPSGISCFMFTLDDKGRLVNARDALRLGERLLCAGASGRAAVVGAKAGTASLPL